MTDTMAQIVVTESAGAPAGIHLTPADTGTQGVRVVVVQGECFGRHIEWFDEEEATAVVTADPATGDPVLSLTRGSGFVHQKRGYETANSTWWRYAEEANPASYREHCLRIVRRL